MRFAGFGLGINRLYAHQSHETLNPLAINLVALSCKNIADRTAAAGRTFHIFGIDASHHLKVVGRDQPGFVIKR